MFCNRCGGIVAADMTICPHCAVLIPQPTIQARPMQAYSVAGSIPTQSLDKHAVLRMQYPDLQGVGGWLGFYAWMEVAVIPLLTLGRAVEQATWSPYWILVALFRVYGMAVGLLVLDESRTALLNVRIRLFIQAGVGLVLIPLGVFWGFRVAAVGVSMVLNSVLWIAYFYLSKRVKLTLDPPLPKR